MAEQFTYADLTYLESMSMGSTEMVNEMIEIFLEQIPEFTEGLADLLQKKDYPALGALAHKAKSSVAVLGMNDLASRLKDLELQAKAAENPDSYPSQVEVFIEQVTTTQKELEKYLNKG